MSLEVDLVRRVSSALSKFFDDVKSASPHALSTTQEKLEEYAQLADNDTRRALEVLSRSLLDKVKAKQGTLIPERLNVLSEFLLFLARDFYGLNDKLSSRTYYVEECYKALLCNISKSRILEKASNINENDLFYLVIYHPIESAFQRVQAALKVVGQLQAAYQEWLDKQSITPIPEEIVVSTVNNYKEGNPILLDQEFYEKLSNLCLKVCRLDTSS